jgi:hypothetical protein
MKSESVSVVIINIQIRTGHELLKVDENNITRYNMVTIL